MDQARPSWEPDWDRSVPGDHLRRLVEELDAVLVRRHFARRTVHDSRPVRFGTVSASPEDVTMWTRYTEDGYVENMMNGVACFGNGLIRVGLDRGHEIQLLAQENAPPDTVAYCVAGFVDRTDARCRTRILRAP